ncbi:ergothioneine biosynthesis protein EgtB [Proteobacteria bacterium 005FR1]|nr:ergothioneine biosynthesis protein EgtB [Proteobacteria bacterium 005FR1]
MGPSTDLLAFYQSVRQQTVRLTENLSPEDMVVQSMTEASPGKWHLAHTTWFFEEFILRKHANSFRLFDENFSYLFNSYYEAVGDRHPRPARGLLTRPDLATVLDYRTHVDACMTELIGRDDLPESTRAMLAEMVVTGLHHEMQHQELLLTDILHLLSSNPLNPAVFTGTAASTSRTPTSKWQDCEGGLVAIGADKGAESADFSYDCERPRHRVWLQPFAIANRLVTNGEWLEFIEDGGYENPLLWLADGWDTCQRENWRTPLYWREVEGRWHQFGLDGLQLLNFAAPVCHISYYEADAYARWAGKRLPSEQEWEFSFADQPIEGNFMESASWRPQPADASSTAVQVYGDVWEWTSSPYMAYPGFKPESGALQEYNGKFMANQFVLRGGSCATSRAQMRPSYRNFFFPQHRWQFSGLRLAEDR